MLPIRLILRTGTFHQVGCTFLALFFSCSLVLVFMLVLCSTGEVHSRLRETKEVAENVHSRRTSVD